MLTLSGSHLYIPKKTPRHLFQEGAPNDSTRPCVRLVPSHHPRQRSDVTYPYNLSPGGIPLNIRPKSNISGRFPSNINPGSKRLVGTFIPPICTCTCIFTVHCTEVLPYTIQVLLESYAPLLQTRLLELGPYGKREIDLHQKYYACAYVQYVLTPYKAWRKYGHTSRPHGEN